MGISTDSPRGDTMRAERIRAFNRCSGISNSSSRQGGIAPPHGLMRKPRSSSKTLCPCWARSCAAVAPEGPPPTTIVS